jgi:uncharacterized membrane protein YtjA (UPF0391 family)
VIRPDFEWSELSTPPIQVGSITLSWAVASALVALGAEVLGFSGVAAKAGKLAQYLLYVSLALGAVSLSFGLSFRRTVGRARVPRPRSTR